MMQRSKGIADFESLLAEFNGGHLLLLILKRRVMPLMRLQTKNKTASGNTAREAGIERRMFVFRTQGSAQHLPSILRKGCRTLQSSSVALMLNAAMHNIFQANMCRRRFANARAAVSGLTGNTSVCHPVGMQLSIVAQHCTISASTL